MYGLNPGIDLSFLQWREVIQVAIGLYQVQFHFDENVQISVEGKFLFFNGEEEVVWQQDLNALAIAGRTVALLGASITKFEGSSDGTLALTFSNGNRLTILDCSQEYESYQIYAPGRNIIV